MNTATTRMLPAGEHAILVEFDEAAELRSFTHHLRADPPPEISDIVPTEHTVMLYGDPATAAADLREIALRSLRTSSAHTAPDHLLGPLITIGVHYDGADLDEAAAICGISPTELMHAHTSATWTCSFIGFAPGFGYLTSPDNTFDIPRRAQSRPHVPAGAVALAGKYSAVYPRTSPGGWQLIGTTDTSLWDLDADPPSLLSAGTRVRFTDLDA
ncbi:5-oxoprolinase subunit B family protein [Nocardia rhamnosiphila]